MNCRINRLLERRIPGLHDGVDDFHAFFEVGDGTLYRVDRDPLEIVQGPAESIGALGEPSRHGRVAHQAVVGIQRHSKAQSPCSRAGF